MKKFAVLALALSLLGPSVVLADTSCTQMNNDCPSDSACGTDNQCHYGAVGECPTGNECQSGSTCSSFIGVCYPDSSSQNSGTFQGSNSPSPTTFQGSNSPSPSGSGGSPSGGININTLKSYEGQIVQIINEVLIPLLYAVAFVVFLFGAFRYFIWGGASEESRKEGKNFVIYAVVGFVVISALWGIVNIVMNVAGLSSTTNHPIFPHL